MTNHLGKIVETRYFAPSLHRIRQKDFCLYLGDPYFQEDSGISNLSY